MIEEIGEIFYTLVIGYIGALELCYIAKHIYHSCHSNLHPESEETRLKELADLQSQLQKAVTESEQKQVEGHQVAKDGVVYKDGYRVNADEKTLHRSKRQIDSTQLPSNNDTKDDKINETPKQDTQNEIASAVNTNAIEVQSQFQSETIENELEKTINNELNSKTKIGENESDKINLEDSQRQSIKNVNETQFVNDFNAKNIENVTIKSAQQLNEAQKNNEAKKESEPNLTDVLIPKIEEKSIENISNKINASQLAESDSNVTVFNESSNVINLNKQNEAISESSSVDSIERNPSLQKNEEEVEEIIISKTEVKSLSSELKKGDSVEELDKIPSESESQITETLKKLDQSNLFIEEVPVLSSSPEQRHDDTESSADEEENSIASVIENKNHKKENDDQYKIVLTEEEKEKVLNSIESDFKFKNLSDVLNASESSKEFVVETPLEEDDNYESSTSAEKGPEEKNLADEENLFSDYDYEMNGTKPLRRSPRMDEIDHYEERWQIEESSHKKQSEISESESLINAEKASTAKSNQFEEQLEIELSEHQKQKKISESEALINAERTEHISSTEKSNQFEEKLESELTEPRTQEKISESEALINAEKAGYNSNTEVLDQFEKQLESELTEQSKQKEMSESEQITLTDNAEGEQSSEDGETADKKAAKLTLDITKSIISNEQLTPSIELFDETGVKSPEVNFESGGISSQPYSPSFDIMEGLSDFYDFNISINPSISRSLSRSTSVLSTDDIIAAQRSRSPSPVTKPPIAPKKIEYLSDFYDFNVALNRAVYRRSQSRGRVSVARDTTEDSVYMISCFNYTLRELDALSNLSVCSLPFKKFGEDFQDNLDSVNRIESNDAIQPDLNFVRSHYVGESTEYSYDFEELREQTRHFVRSRSPSISFESDMVAIDMSDYRKEIQNNILKELEEKSSHSTLGVASFVERERRESDSALIKNSEIIFEIQDDPDFIVTYKNDSHISMDIELEPEEYHHFRRFSLQQECQYEEYPEDEFVYVDDSTLKLIESDELIESESNEQAVEDSVINLDDLSLSTEQANELIINTLTEDITPESNEDSDDTKEDLSETKKNVEDSVINLEDLSLSTEEANELIIKTLTEDITPESNEYSDDTKEDHSETKKNVEDSVINLEDLSLSTEEANELIIKTLTEDITPESNEDSDDTKEDLGETKKNKTAHVKINEDLDEVDLTYVPKKEYNWRKKFKIYEDEEENALVLSKTKESKSNDNIEAAKSKEKFVEGDTENNDLSVTNNDAEGKESFVTQSESEQIAKNTKTKMESSSEILEGNPSKDFQTHYKSSDNIENTKTEEEDNEKLNMTQEKEDVAIDELETKKLNDKSEQIPESPFENSDVETVNLNTDQDEKDRDGSFDEESFDIINEEAILNIDNGNNLNNGDENLDNIIDNDDGIDEEIFDYNDRPDDSYNQSEDGDNNYDFDTYSENQINEVPENLNSYNNESVNNVSDDKESQEDENLVDKNLENPTNSTNTDEKLDSGKIQNQDDNEIVNKNTDNQKNTVLNKQFDEMYDDCIRSRRESRIQRDYDGLVEKMNTTYDDDVASVTTDDMIEQIYFKDLSPSRYERLGSEESFCSNFSSISQGSLYTRSKYKGISHARQIKSDRLRSRYGIAPAIGQFANFENTDDIAVSYIPRTEYNWRKNFKLDDLDTEKNKTKSSETCETLQSVELDKIDIAESITEKTKENPNTEKLDNKDNEIIEKNLNSIKKKARNTDGLNKRKAAETLGSENVEKILNEKIDTIYDEASRNRRKSRLEREFEKIAEETDVKLEEFQELDSIPTQKILEDLLDASNDTNQKNQEEILQKPEKISKKIKIKKKVRKSSIISDEIAESAKANPIESNEITETVEKPKKKKTSRKNSLVPVKNDDDNIELTSKVIKKVKKSKKRSSIDNSEQFYSNDNPIETTASKYFMMTESVSPDKINESANTPNESLGTPNESIIDDAEKYSNPSISNSSLSLKTDEIKDQNDLDINEAKQDHIRENDILELIKDSSILLGSSF